MALPLEQFVKQLEDSGIIASETLKDFIPPKANPKNAEELARELVVKKKLTKFQANEAYQGKARSLRLGNYTLLDKIGQGGMGQVFKAEHRRMHRIVAIKMLPPALTKDAAALARFEREVTAAAKLGHPNIVAADDADEAKGVHFLVMEYVEGRDLSALVKRDGPFPVDKAVNYVLQAARGLEFAHGEGVVHRDIKPANLLLDMKGTVKILDMGLARIEVGGDAETQAELTGTGMVMGTVDYMAPEQGMNTKNADARADIYSLGCTLYYLLIGKPVYRAETVMARMVAHLQEPIPNLCQLRSEVPLQVDTVFQKMVAKKIGDRYQSMAEVVADLERCGVGRDVSFSGQHSLGLDNDEGLLTFLRDIPVQTTHKPRATKSAKAAGQGGSKNKKPLLIGAGVLGVLGLLLSVIISLRTKDGTLIVEVNQPDAVVQVLSEEGKVEISEPGGLNPTSISVVPGKHRIRVEKDGFVAISDDIEIASGGSLDIKARLVPKAGKGPVASGQGPVKTWETPAFQAWLKTVATLTAAKQVEAVAKKLVELNPGFDGKVTPSFEGRVVTGLELVTDNVTNISPVRALAGLKSLAIRGTYAGGGRGASGTLQSLSPLAGMQLTFLNCEGNSRLADLSPLIGMKLTSLFCGTTDVSDVSPLQGMPLTKLTLIGTKDSDLSPLKGMHLKSLEVHYTKVSDLSPLAGMPLAHLNCLYSQASDLSPLQGMPLTFFWCSYTQVSDLSPLQGMPLATFWCYNTPVADLSPLQDCKTLTSLNVKATKVSPAQVAALQQTLPNCMIEWDGPAKAPTSSPASSPATEPRWPFDPQDGREYVWSEPENLGPKINSDEGEYQPFISADGLVLVFASSRSGNSDLYECRRKSAGEPFGEAAALKGGNVNTISIEGAPFLAADGLTLLFVSTQGAGQHQGGPDIYLAERANRDAKWGQSVNLGPLVNSASYDYDPCLSPDGLTLYFNSNQPGGVGKFDLWRSRRKSLAAAWEAAENLGPGINTPDSQGCPRLAADGRTLFYQNSTDHSLMRATPMADGGWKTERLDAPDKDPLGYAFSADGGTLYFASKRAGGLGDFDLWLSRRVPK